MVLTFPSLPRRIYGFFTGPGETTPTYDPGFETPCLYCSRQLTRTDVRTFSLMTRGRSYFYRTHRSCAEKARRAGVPANSLDQTILDAIKANGD